MSEVFAFTGEMLNEVFDFPLVRFCIFVPLFLAPVFMFLRLLLDDTSSHLDLTDLLCAVGSWLKNKFIDLAIMVLGFEKVYKLGWARPGVDFFDCGQDCAVCPKYDECHSDLRCEEVSQDE